MKWNQEEAQLKQKVMKQNKKQRIGTKSSETDVAIWQHEQIVMKRNKKVVKRTLINANRKNKK